MQARRERGRAKYRLTVKLDVEWDADLIAWLQGMAPGSRSALIRDTLRTGLRQPVRWDPVDVNELRRVMVEELGRALAGHAFASPAAKEGEPPRAEDIEAQYGAKLDKMLGSLRKGSSTE